MTLSSTSDFQQAHMLYLATLLNEKLKSMVHDLDPLQTFMMSFSLPPNFMDIGPMVFERSCERSKTRTKSTKNHKVLHRGEKKTPTLPKVKCGLIIFCGFLVASHTGGLENVGRIIKSNAYQDILEQNVLLSVKKLDLGWPSWVHQLDNDPKHTSESMEDWLRKS